MISGKKALKKDAVQCLGFVSKLKKITVNCKRFL